MNKEKSETTKLCDAVDEFAEHMKDRLLCKMVDGYTGWDSEDILVDELTEKAYAKLDIILQDDFDNSEFNMKHAVDLGNFAMMLARRGKED